jgi:hypothetical protein
METLQCDASLHKLHETAEAHVHPRVSSSKLLQGVTTKFGCTTHTGRAPHCLTPRALHFPSVYYSVPQTVLRGTLDVTRCYSHSLSRGVAYTEIQLHQVPLSKSDVYLWKVKHLKCHWKNTFWLTPSIRQFIQLKTTHCNYMPINFVRTCPYIYIFSTVTKCLIIKPVDKCTKFPDVIFLYMDIHIVLVKDTSLSDVKL